MWWFDESHSWAWCHPQNAPAYRWTKAVGSFWSWNPQGQAMVGKASWATNEVSSMERSALHTNCVPHWMSQQGFDIRRLQVSTLEGVRQGVDNSRASPRSRRKHSKEGVQEPWASRCKTAVPVQSRGLVEVKRWPSLMMVVRKSKEQESKDDKPAASVMTKQTTIQRSLAATNNRQNKEVSGKHLSWQGTPQGSPPPGPSPWAECFWEPDS